MIIRKATKKDINNLAKVIYELDRRTKSWEDIIRKYLNKKRHIILIAFDRKNIAGYIFFDDEDKDKRLKQFVKLEEFASIALIAIIPPYRRKGIGSKLLNAVEKYAKEWKKVGIVLDCKKQAIEFYEKRNYKQIGYFIKKKNVKKPRRQYVMEKRLK
jgi:ribosomal protein S18 acetylase RimI-like enzyme